MADVAELVERAKDANVFLLRVPHAHKHCDVAVAGSGSETDVHGHVHVRVPSARVHRNPVAAQTYRARPVLILGDKLQAAGKEALQPAEIGDIPGVLLGLGMRLIGRHRAGRRGLVLELVQIERHSVFGNPGTAAKYLVAVFQNRGDLRRDILPLDGLHDKRARRDRALCENDPAKSRVNHLAHRCRLNRALIHDLLRIDDLVHVVDDAAKAHRLDLRHVIGIVVDAAATPGMRTRVGHDIREREVVTPFLVRQDMLLAGAAGSDDPAPFGNAVPVIVYQHIAFVPLDIFGRMIRRIIVRVHQLVTVATRLRHLVRVEGRDFVHLGLRKTLLDEVGPCDTGNMSTEAHRFIERLGCTVDQKFLVRDRRRPQPAG